MKHKIFAISIFIFIVLQILVILGSWFVTVVFPTLPVRSMLSSEGIRWFLGQYTSNLASPLLVWLVLAGMTYGALRSSGLSRAIMHFSNISYRQRFALKVVVAELILFAIVLFLMTFLPQAILLSVTGELFPSSFSRSLIPFVCFLLTLFSITYGLINASFSSLTDIFNSLTSGITATSPWLVIYVFVIQLYYSILFVVVT
ncbi:AbgT family transporter [Hoylesella timonensis]|uniref:ABC transporter substrate-binding protein n=1 Tax=Hoylesella timonensis TaxID=386414 RepID=A0A2N6Q6K0_9BACT|nr:AbgT family transporter [Hoylesella timonensis]PMC10608.1 ABC transporter substrate-binding protein [Hoylesella timonensis]